MKRRCGCSFLILVIILIQSSSEYEIEQPQLELLSNGFSLSIEDDPDIKWVAFNVNVNKEFEFYETPQLNCMVALPRQRRWSCELQRTLREHDIVYTWLMVNRNGIFYRDRKNPISVGALMRGDRNYILTTTTRAPGPLVIIQNKNMPPVSDTNCQAAITIFRNMEGRICREQLIFEDNFDQLNAEHWTNEIRIPTTRLDSEFVIYNGSAVVNDGVLKISANVSNHGINKVFDLGERCTASSNIECRYEPRLHHFLPPIVSGRINTAKYFNFKYGRIEVKAKVPKGNWLFPLITLQPSNDANGSPPSATGEIRVAFVRGNQDLMWNDISIGGDTLFGGPVFSLAANERHRFMSNITLSQRLDDSTTFKHFGNKFHAYSLLWTVNELVLSVDGMEYGKIHIDPKWKERDSNVPFDKMFYITLGLAAGGHGDFPENIQNKPWENTDPKAIKTFNKQQSNWIGTWTQPSLEIDYVRVYAV